jgi:hypothetical protein
MEQESQIAHSESQNSKRVEMDFLKADCSNKWELDWIVSTILLVD